ncbi:MAG: GWxTD domain-containing protein, partial [Candidatus Cloacimonadaceae bacterium]|nr:GWxTD domain-containing protein [Candidatus Cloacimonadaceae bacterium]
DMGKLPQNSLISDVELCSVVRPDSSSYLDKFRRGKTLFQPQPSMILDKGAGDIAYIYFEVYPPAAELGISQLLVLSIEKDSVLISDDYIDFIPVSMIEGLTLKIPIAGLDSGKYHGTVSLQIGDEFGEKSFEFFITEIKEERLFLLIEPDDDYQILRYFLGSSVPADWRNLDINTKRRYITQMWKNLARSVNLDTKDLIGTVRERVDYADRYFGHFKPGRTTDMGRIYIRNGKPDEVEKDTTSDETRYVRKDYQIWKYRGRINAVYVFIDLQMTGNYQLIFVKNDESESTNPDYLRYLGDGFDASKLSN